MTEHNRPTLQVIIEAFWVCTGMTWFIKWQDIYLDHTKKALPEKSVNLGWQKPSCSGLFLKQRWVGRASILRGHLCGLKKGNRLNNWGERLKGGNQKGNLWTLYFEQVYIWLELILESSISFSNPFKGTVTFLKVEWLHNLSCKAYNTTTAFHNWNEKKKCFQHVIFSLF